MKVFSKCGSEGRVNTTGGKSPKAAGGASRRFDRVRRPRGFLASFADGLGSAASIMDVPAAYVGVYRGRSFLDDWAVVGHDIRRAAKRVAQDEQAILLLPEPVGKEVLRWQSKPTKRSGPKRAP